MKEDKRREIAYSQGKQIANPLSPTILWLICLFFEFFVEKMTILVLIY
jgi:hypothetical protein